MPRNECQDGWTLEQAVRAAQKPDVLASLALILDGASASGQCRACGECCRFERFDHRLYVTPAELAWLLAVPPPQPAAPLRCPYQAGARCMARERRPLGCRIFFCDGGESDQYEAVHAQVKDLHQKLRVPYAYVELSGALMQLIVEE
jgi:Fe-S-cluster containining protein